MHAALLERTPYDLICLDIMMPGLDGQEVLRQIRRLEEESGVAPAHRVKVIMTTALAGRANVMEAIEGGCDAYLIKPIQRLRLLEELRRLELIP